MPPSLEQQQDRQARRRLAILRHAEEISGNVAQTCRYYGISGHDPRRASGYASSARSDMPGCGLSP